MKQYLFTLLACIISSHLLFGQNDNANLLAQSPDGKTVKLVWSLKNLPQDFSGFDIKRKDGLGDWQKLNRQTILPGISQKKSLAEVESDATEVARIKENLRDLLKNGKLREYNYSTFVNKWRNNEKEIQDIIMLAALDFDVSIICGFGYVDHTVTQKTDYQYGLFAHGSDKLLARATWNYGEIPDLNVIRDITSKATLGKNGVQLIWNADMNRLKTGYVAGFNIYKRGIRLNDQPIFAVNPNDPSEFMWYDVAARSSIADQYSISAVSLFGIEGIIRSYTFNPADHPNKYEKATVTNISSRGFYYKDGTGIKWSFPKEQERFIKGFLIEKDNVPGGYFRATELIAPDQRSVVDQSPSSVNSYIRVRILTVYNDKTIAYGPEKLYNYFPMVDPPKPQNIRAIPIVENKKNLVRITWDAPISGDSISHHYKIYTIDKENNKFVVLADKLPLRPTAYMYTMPTGTASNYKFFVSAVTKHSVESIHSDTVSIHVPTTELPAPVVRKSFPDGKSATIQWDYPAITDLLGFRLYMNETLIADETILKKNTHQFTTDELQPGSSNDFTIRAITDRGVISEPSIPTNVALSTRRK